MLWVCEKRSGDGSWKMGNSIRILLEHTYVSTNNTIQLTDVEEEINPKDPKFAKIIKISKAEAEKQALKVIAGKIVDREYSIEKGNPIYEFDILDKKSKKEIEVEIDGVTGKVLEKEYEFFEVGVES